MKHAKPISLALALSIALFGCDSSHEQPAQ